MLGIIKSLISPLDQYFQIDWTMCIACVKAGNPGAECDREVAQIGD